MKVFISWSGTKGRKIAEALKEWIPSVVQSVNPWVSSQDIPAGGRGLKEMATELEACTFGILCLTQENKQAPWINFEAGALSKMIDASRVVPFLFDLNISDITGPLTQFQAVKATEKEQVFSMLKSLSEAPEGNPLSTERLRIIFEKFWPDLESTLADIREGSEEAMVESSRSERDILEELLALTRSMDTELARVRVVNIKAADTVIAMGREGSPWPSSSWTNRLSERIIAQLNHSLKSTGVRITSGIIDDEALHIVITGTGDAVDEESMDEAFQLALDEYFVPIHVLGEPIGEKFFNRRRRRRRAASRDTD